MKHPRLVLIMSLFMGLAPRSYVVYALDLSSYVGYTIAAAKTITGYKDKDGKHSDDFEGCDFDRVIVFDDGTQLVCSSYSYTYAYRPEAVILIKNTEFQGRKVASVVMIVDDDEYDMRPLLSR
jgi:hypothetical protein